MGKKFSDLAAATMPPEALERARQKADEMSKAIAADDLKEALAKTREALARELDLESDAVVLLERHADLYLACLRRQVEAMGGRLEMVAWFGGAEVLLEQLSEVESVPVGAK
jgi:hypothetical protein